jgi:hypothetical protein
LHERHESYLDDALSTHGLTQRNPLQRSIEEYERDGNTK